MIIHINGWPGVGKKTVGEILAKSIEARFIHNHTLHDVALSCAGFDDDRWPLYEKVRHAAYDVLAARPKKEIFVMTNSLSRESKREVIAWNHVVDLAIRRSVPLIPINLISRLEVISSRIVSENRSEMKLKCPRTLKSIISRYSLQKPSVNEFFELETSNLSPDESSNRIVEYISSVRRNLEVATSQYYQLG